MLLPFTRDTSSPCALYLKTLPHAYLFPQTSMILFSRYFRLAKGFSMNSALERSATIVDAPDLAPETAHFFITEAGISDDEVIKYPENSKEKKKTLKNEKQEDNKSDFELISASEDEKNTISIKKKTTKKSSRKK